MRSRWYLVVCLFVLGTCLWGQATSQIQGVVLDPAGAAIPSAEIKATQTDTGLVRTATSSTDGTYVLTNLPIGPYRLDVTKQGFKTYSQTGIVLQVATNPTVNVSLQLGAVSESIQVESNATLVETQTTSVGRIDRKSRGLSSCRSTGATQWS